MQRLALVVGLLAGIATAQAQSGGSKSCDVFAEARSKGQLLLLFNQVSSSRVAMLATDGLEVTLVGRGSAEGGGCSAKDLPLTIALRAPADAPGWIAAGVQQCATLAATAAGSGLRLTIYVTGKAESFPGKPIKEQFVWRPGASVRCEVAKD